jgi:hypothetical protein
VNFLHEKREMEEETRPRGNSQSAEAFQGIAIIVAGSEPDLAREFCS